MSVPSATAQTLVKNALKKLGVINSRDIVDPQDMKDGLEALWFMLDGWNAQDLMIPFITNVVFSVSSSKRIYTYGTGADFDSPRPLKILTAKWVNNDGGTEYPIRLTGYQLFNEGYPFKNSTVGRPDQMWVNPTYPAATVEFESFPLGDDQLSLQVLIPFSAETCACCSGSECDTGCVDPACPAGNVDPDDYTVTVAGCAEGDDACILSGETQMDTYLATQCSTDCDTTYEQTFQYDPGGGDINIVATAVPTVRTSLKPTQLSLTEATEFPPGYQNLIIWNLAEYLAPEYNMDPPMVVIKESIRHMGFLKKRNSRPTELSVDNALTYGANRYNIFSGPTTGV